MTITNKIHQPLKRIRLENKHLEISHDIKNVTGNEKYGTLPK